MGAVVASKFPNFISFFLSPTSRLGKSEPITSVWWQQCLISTATLSYPRRPGSCYPLPTSKGHPSAYSAHALHQNHARPWKILPTITSLGGLSAVMTTKPSPAEACVAFTATSDDAEGATAQVMASWACTDTGLHVSGCQWILVSEGSLWWIQFDDKSSTRS